MKPAFNYHHLHYFWVVAKEGSMARAADRLGVAVQTVSAQVRALERDLGCALLKPAGRGLALTEAGHEALRQADPIFQAGEALPSAVREASTARGMRLVVGISDAVPKLVVQRILRPVLAEPGLRLVCHEGEFAELLGELALHRLDVVLADRPAPQNRNLRVYAHPLGVSSLAWYGTPEIAARARRGFPASLERVPLLLPTAHSAVRERLDAWMEARALRATVAGEFEDSALMKAFGAEGLGAFPAPVWIEPDLVSRYGVRRIGPCEGVEERFHAIDTAKKVAHPLVQRIVSAADLR